eukprot:151751-Rhodomonas_salina.1
MNAGTPCTRVPLARIAAHPGTGGVPGTRVPGYHDNHEDGRDTTSRKFASNAAKDSPNRSADSADSADESVRVVLPRMEVNAFTPELHLSSFSARNDSFSGQKRDHVPC